MLPPAPALTVKDHGESHEDPVLSKELFAITFAAAAREGRSNAATATSMSTAIADGRYALTFNRLLPSAAAAAPPEPGAPTRSTTTGFSRRDIASPSPLSALTGSRPSAATLTPSAAWRLADYELVRNWPHEGFQPMTHRGAAVVSRSDGDSAERRRASIAGRLTAYRR